MAKQYGGEGKETYSGKKSVNGEGKQHGGEGSQMGKKGGSMNPNMGLSGEAYCGPGRYIATS
jgi:hypothetical protein